MRWHPLAVTALAALGPLALPFWWALGVVLAWVGWATCETLLWYRACRAERRRHDVRAFIQRELDKMPRREEPTQRQVLMHVSEHPAAWQPFVQRPSASGGRHASR